MAGPAYCAEATPVKTKIPVPMMAPMPRVIRLMGPRARRRLCSPVSCASERIRLSGLVASRLAIQCSPHDLRCATVKSRHCKTKSPLPAAKGSMRCLHFLVSDLLPKLAVTTAVGEIDNQSDHQPANQSQPVFPFQAVDHRSTHNDAKSGDHRHGGGLEC